MVVEENQKDTRGELVIVDHPPTGVMGLMNEATTLQVLVIPAANETVHLLSVAWKTLWASASAATREVSTGGLSLQRCIPVPPSFHLLATQQDRDRV